MCCVFFFFFFKQKTAYEMRISYWSSDVCSSDLQQRGLNRLIELDNERLETVSRQGWQMLNHRHKRGLDTMWAFMRCGTKTREQLPQALERLDRKSVV